MAVNVLRYSFDIINGRLEGIRNGDRKTIKTLTVYKMCHHKADIDALYVKRTEEVRDLLQTEATCKAEIINTADYLNTKYRED